MENIITLIKILLISQPVFSTDICLYGRRNTNSIINGLYIEENIYDNKPYYKKTAGYCTTYYIYWRASGSGKWVIDNSLGSSVYHAYCDESSTASDCHTWYVYQNGSFVLDSDVQLLLNSCPAPLNCDAITIPNAPNNCDSFDINLGNGIWKDSTASRWWYFDDYYFAWHCVDYVPTGCSGSYYAWLQQGWIDLSKGQSTTVQMEWPNTNYYTFNCIDNNPSPTNSPTNVPTNVPTTLDPTNNPSIPPTKVPTLHPSDAPTTNIPTVHPSKTPTVQPTETPTVYVEYTVIPSKTDDYGEGSIPDHVTTQTSMSAVVGNAHATNDDSSFWTVFIVFLVLILICIFCLLFVFMYKYKKDKATTDVKNIKNAVYSIDRKSVIDIKLQMQRDRVNTNSQYIDNDDDEKENIEAVADGDPKTPQIPGNDPSGNHDSAELAVEFNEFNNSFADTPGNIPNLASYAETFAPPIFNTGITDEEMVQQEGNETMHMAETNGYGVKEWLDKLKFPQYYDVFMKNGFDSLDIVSIIAEEKELTEIGIVLKGHRLKLLKEIECLRNEINSY